MSSTEVAKTSASAGDRFTGMIIKELTSMTGEVSISDFQRKLAANYFIKIDTVLKDAEKKRLAKREDQRDETPVTWENLNSAKLAQDVVAYSSIGLDPLQPNHINIIPFKNSLTKKYDINFMMGYRGLELKATKFGVDVIDVIVELVYSNDKFKSLKKDRDVSIETYTFDVIDDFNRGEIVGGFYYHRYKNNPEKNKLRVLTLEQIKKRAPKYASTEFWGGEKDIWKNGVKTKEKEIVDGWFDEMCYKTIARAAYNDITIDSEKINDHLLTMLRNDEEYSSQSYTQISGGPEKQGNLKEFNIDNAEDAESEEVKDEAKQLDASKTEEVKVETKKEEPKPVDKKVNNPEPVLPSLNFD